MPPVRTPDLDRVLLPIESTSTSTPNLLLPLSLVAFVIADRPHARSLIPSLTPQIRYQSQRMRRCVRRHSPPRPIHDENTTVIVIAFAVAVRPAIPPRRTPRCHGGRSMHEKEKGLGTSTLPRSSFVVAHSHPDDEITSSHFREVYAS